MVLLDDRTGAGELRRRRGLGAGGTLLVAVHQLADLLLHLGQLGQRHVHTLEVGDDLALDDLPLGRGRGPLEARGNVAVLLPVRRDQGLGGSGGLAHGNASSRASRSSAERSRPALSTTMVRPGRVMMPLMYRAARPRTMGGGEAIVRVSTRRTSLT